MSPQLLNLLFLQTGKNCSFNFKSRKGKIIGEEMDNNKKCEMSLGENGKAQWVGKLREKFFEGKKKLKDAFKLPNNNNNNIIIRISPAVFSSNSPVFSMNRSEKHLNLKEKHFHLLFCGEKSLRLMPLNKFSSDLAAERISRELCF
jgi:hypothetical protein